MLNELRNVRSSIEELRGLAAPHTRVTVLAHGRREWDQVYEDGRMEDLWFRLQLDFANRLHADALVVAPRSGHQIPLEDPGIVVRTVQRIAEEIRSERQTGR